MTDFLEHYYRHREAVAKANLLNIFMLEVSLSYRRCAQSDTSRSAAALYSALKALVVMIERNGKVCALPGLLGPFVLANRHLVFQMDNAAL